MKRILYLSFLVGSISMVSFYGGNISYLLFYFAILLPMLAFAYSIYVYSRFKIVQDMKRTVVKAQKVPYSLTMANEDFIPFTNITLNYHTEKVTFQEFEDREGGEETKQDTNHLCLLPGAHIHIDTKMYCKYRGTYAVGVKSVTVTDFLGLFTITYTMREQVRVTVRPRIIPFEQIAKSVEMQDSKNNLFSVAKSQELLDFELRPYQPGDTMKYIHWKNSAKAGELLVRKQMPEEMFEMTVILDLSPVRGSIEQQLKTEDSIIETAVSFLNHYCMKKIPVTVVYMEKELQEFAVNDSRGFDRFYRISPDIIFRSGFSIEQVWAEYIRKVQRADTYILITSSISDGLRHCLEENRRMGRDAVIVDTGELQL